MSRKKQAASQRKQQGRLGKLQAGGRAAAAGSSSKKDAGLPSFFKHRKEAFARAAAEAAAAEAQRNEESMQQDDSNSSHAESSRNTKGKQKALNGDAVEDAQMDSFTGRTLSEGILDTQREVDETNANGSFTFSSTTDSNPFISEAADPALTGHRDSSLRAYMAQLRKLISSSDILLQVLDARDPLSCRSYATETLALSQGKRIVLVLNKIDLVPRENVEKWLKYLRHDFPTLAFKSSTQMQRKNLAQGAGSVPSSKGDSSGGGALSSGSEALGAQALLQLLKNYSRNQNLKTSLTVGIFGAPNVGKSSLINSLKRARVCAVASTPGHTKVLQSVMLDKKIRLIDCPGIVFNEKAKGATAGLASGPEAAAQASAEFDARAAALRNVVKVELLQDPISPIAVVLSRVPLEQLQKLYDLPPLPLQPDEDGNPYDATKPMTAPTLEDVQAFLLRLALRKGRLLAKGGAPDLEGTARSILQDWNNGKIKYATQPPAVHRSVLMSANLNTGSLPVQNTNAASSESKEDREKAEAAAAIAATSSIKTSFDAEFDLAGLLGEADAEALLGAGSAAAENGSGMDTSETPHDGGRGSLAASKDGKPLLEARERRYATDADLNPTADKSADIEVEEESVTLANQTVSSLGKRRRAMDDSEEEEDEEDEDEDENDGRFFQHKRGPRAHVPGLDSDDEENDDEMGDIRAGKSARKAARIEEASENGFDEIVDLPSWLERQRSKASTAKRSKKANEKGKAADSAGKMALLGTVFSPAELENMAPSRSASRKKARKEKRRAERSSAGGLTHLVEAGMDFEDDDEHENTEEDQVLNPAISLDEGNSATASKRSQGAFSMLAVDQLEDEEEL